MGLLNAGSLEVIKNHLSEVIFSLASVCFLFNEIIMFIDG